MTNRKTYGISTVTATVLVVAVLIVVNLISSEFFARADLTEAKMFTLSEASRQVAANVKDPLYAKVYVSPDLPPDLLRVRQYLVDLLSEYRAYGQGNFSLEVINPTTPEQGREAQGYGISPFQAQVIQSDKMELKRVYLGVVFIHADRQESIPAVTDTRGLEFQLTSAIRRVTRQSLGVVGVVQNTAGPTLEQGLTNLQKSVGKEYRIRSVDLSTQPVPADVTVLAVIGPQQSFSDTTLYHIDQFVMRGGSAMFLLDGCQVNLGAPPQQGGGMAFPVPNNVDSLAQWYGAAPRAGVMVDARHNQIQAMQALGPIQIPVAIQYPFFLAAGSSDKEQVLGAGVDRLDLLFASPLNLTPQSGTSLDVIVRSSPKSGVKTLPAMVAPPINIPDSDYSQPNQPLVATIEGQFHSYYADTLHPAPALLGPGHDTAYAATGVDARMVVVGDADLATDQAMTQFNQVFVLNAIDWLSRNDLLIALRSKTIEDRPLENIDAGDRSKVKWANLFGPPLLVILFGLVRWRRRAARRRSV